MGFQIQPCIHSNGVSSWALNTKPQYLVVGAPLQYLVWGLWGSGLGAAAFRAPKGARTLLGIWVGLCGWLGTFIVSGLGVVGIWAWSGSISGRQDETRRGGPPACLVVAPNAAGDLGTFK